MNSQKQYKEAYAIIRGIIPLLNSEQKDIRLLAVDTMWKAMSESKIDLQIAVKAWVSYCDNNPLPLDIYKNETHPLVVKFWQYHLIYNDEYCVGRENKPKALSAQKHADRIMALIPHKPRKLAL